MATTVGEMTTGELQAMIESIIEQKLTELLGDPDEGLPLHESLRERLVQQKEAVAAGERGDALDDVARRLGVE